MAETTTLLGMTLPGTSDAADITQLTDNFSKIEEYLQTYVRSTGLGRGAASVDSLDNATKFGLYQSNVGVPGISGKVYWTCLVMPFDPARTIVQIAYQATYDPVRFAIRRMTGNEWGEWEYPNPPMAAGVEYRTIERYGGKPVYKKRIVYVSGNGTNPEITDAGAVKTISIAHGIAGFGELVSISAHQGTYALPVMDSNGYLTLANSVTSTYINLRTNGVWTGERTWSFEVAYTKA